MVRLGEKDIGATAVSETARMSLQNTNCKLPAKFVVVMYLHCWGDLEFIT